MLFEVGYKDRSYYVIEAENIAQVKEVFPPSIFSVTSISVMSLEEAKEDKETRFKGEILSMSWL